jgi:chaperonin GroEL (HSP60 family)
MIGRLGRLVADEMRAVRFQPQAQVDVDATRPFVAREKVLRGATALADAVRVTLGPKSKCVLIEKEWG